MVWEELGEKRIFLNLKAEKKECVLQILGEAMIEEGYAETGYVESLIEREQKFPTGLDMRGVGIAIPHTDADYVEKAGIALAVLERPVSFYRMGREDERVEVQLVFMLAIENPEAHLSYLQQILAVIRDIGVLKKLIEAKEKSEVIEIVKQKEEAD